MVFGKKRKKKKEDVDDPEVPGIDDEDIIEFDEFAEFDEELKKKDEDPREIAKHFIFTVENGCPICGDDVKGNDYFNYFCEHCNVLFEKKDILEQEFGRNLAEARKGGVRKTLLSEDERAELEKKRKELNDRIFKTFSEEQKQDLIEETEEERAEEEDEPVEEQEPEDEDVIDEVPDEEEDTKEPEEEPEEEPMPAHQVVDAVFEEQPEELQDAEQPEGLSPEAARDDEEEPEPEDDEDADDEEPEPEPEYELEEEGKIIASSESDKLHKGNCHFVKRIHPENRIYFETIESGEDEGYEMCVCLRRLRALQRSE